MVMVTDFRTLDLPVGDRFTSWHDMTASALIPNVIRSEHDADFRASARVLELGGIRVSSLTYPPLETRRPASMVRRSDPESLQLMITRRGSHRILQSGRDATSGPGEVLLYDTSRPWQGWASAGQATVEGVMVQFPRALLPLPADKVRRLVCEPMPGQDGMGALLSTYLTQLTAGADTYTAADGARLAGLTVDLMTAFLARRLEAADRVPPHSRSNVQMLEIRAFIHRHLGDPELTPGAIAAAHNLSVRSLHRLFRDHGVTVAGWIRARRLERCRRDLADPLLHTRPVRGVAARWGFTDPAHFSRAFRAAYGHSPQAYRRLHQ